MGYHLRDIVKGEVGEFSKIQEEIEELQDAADQNSNMLVLCELADLIGAIECFVENKFNLTLQDLISFSNMTKSAFADGKRK